MSDRYILDLLAPWSEDDAYGIPCLHDALDYLRFVEQEAPDQLLQALCEALNASQWLAGALIPLYADALIASELSQLEQRHPETGPYLRDSGRADLPLSALQPWPPQLGQGAN